MNNINEEKEEEKNDETEEKINELENKRNQLIQNYLTLKFYKKFNKLNQKGIPIFSGIFSGDIIHLIYYIFHRILVLNNF